MTLGPSSPGAFKGGDDIGASSYDYELPDKAIRLSPPDDRGASLMMVVPRRDFLREELLLSNVTSLADHLLPGDLLVVNDTRVVPARVYGKTLSGRSVEVLFLSFGSLLDPRVRFLARNPGKSTRELYLSEKIVLSGIRRLEEEDCYEGLLPAGVDFLSWLQTEGEIPLPPYIQKHRRADLGDRERYQTVFSRFPGSVAAPTAGLHLSETILESLALRGVEQAFVTLHVGAGTFRPLSGDRLSDHRMHQESFDVPEETVAAIQRTRHRGGRVIAVGTTVVRTLESMGKMGKRSGQTDLFIRPGFSFVHVDGLLTNFHQPRSTLLVLLDSFLGGGGSWRILYQEALLRGLSFLSYGDACLILPDKTGT